MAEEDTNKQGNAVKSDETSLGGRDRFEESPKTERRSKPQSVEELFNDALPGRARNASDKLKDHVRGRTFFSFKGSSEGYLLDWTEADLKVSKAKEAVADCTVTISEADLMRIVQGDLNPQIAMLSHKVEVKGKINQAMYVFNLIAPPVSI